MVRRVRSSESSIATARSSCNSSMVWKRRVRIRVPFHDSIRVINRGTYRFSNASSDTNTRVTARAWAASISRLRSERSVLYVLTAARIFSAYAWVSRWRGIPAARASASVTVIRIMSCTTISLVVS